MKSLGVLATRKFSYNERLEIAQLSSETSVL